MGAGDNRVGGVIVIEGFGKPADVSESTGTAGYVRCGADDKYSCEYKKQTYQNVYDGLFTETELAARVLKLESAIRKVVEDEESENGWGPDITTLNFLKEAINT